MIALYLLTLHILQLAQAWSYSESGNSIESRRSSIVDGNIEYVGCTPDNLQLMKEAVRDAELLAKEAYKLAYKGNEYYDAFFGEANSATRPNDDDVKKRFETLSNIATSSGTQRQIIHCYQGAATDALFGCKGFGSELFTDMKTLEIHACHTFQNKVLPAGLTLKNLQPPATKTCLTSLDQASPAGGKLLHEFTHALWQTTDLKMDGKKLYSHEGTLRSVERYGTRARMNADNYHMFAVAAYWSNRDGKWRWSMDPDRIDDPCAHHPRHDELRRKSKRGGKLSE